MRRAGVAICACVLQIVLSTPAAGQGGRADLGKARTLYNQRQFDEAIVAAMAARRAPELADAAAVVLARAHLERYRTRLDPADLEAARAALSVVRADSLDPRDRVELLLAFGQTLFLSEEFGAAASIFESGLDYAATTDAQLADSVLEWWASAIERQAGRLARQPRIEAFHRLATRAQEELARNPTSAAASYWSVVALRGEGELDRAWDGAIAAWVRARLVGERAPALRSDLDRLVLQGIIPDRARHLPLEQRANTESQLRAEWEQVKERWR
jgi:hypothetical protein